MTLPGLLGDIGATNARFALTGAAGGSERQRVLACDDYPSLAAAIGAYLAEAGLAEPPLQAALAVASPVTGDAVRLTNHPWSFSIDGLQRELALTRLVVVNDFVANALAVPRLSPEDRRAVGGGAGVSDAPIGVLGPGTGLGVSGLVPTPAGFIALASEGGHATMAPADEQESAVIDRLRQRFGHVSAERVLSGQGLVNLHAALADLAGVPAEPFTPAEITDRALGESEPLVRAAVDLFCAMLGTVAGNLALTLGARGGIYITGGIVPRLGERFARSAFRQRFEAKGRFHAYLAAIPTYVVTHPVPAFLGLAALLSPQAR
ncbi:MAG: glucokinase [Stellaceae bacterium]